MRLAPGRRLRRGLILLALSRWPAPCPHGGRHAHHPAHGRRPGPDRAAVRPPSPAARPGVVPRPGRRPARFLRRGGAAVRGERRPSRRSGPGSGRPRTATSWAPGTSPPRSPAAGDGPLAGRRVAVKDNIAVAGVPMMNGSARGRGVRPAPGRHRGHQAAGRGRDHRREGGLRGPVLLRRQPHLPHRAGAQPLGPVQDRGRVLQRQRRAGRGRARPTSRSAATRAARSASPAPSAAPSGTSRPTAWSPTPARSRSRTPSTTWARSPGPCGTPR